MLPSNSVRGMEGRLSKCRLGSSRQEHPTKYVSKLPGIRFKRRGFRGIFPSPPCLPPQPHGIRALIRIRRKTTSRVPPRARINELRDQCRSPAAKTEPSFGRMRSPSYRLLWLELPSRKYARSGLSEYRKIRYLSLKKNSNLKPRKVRNVIFG